MDTEAQPTERDRSPRPATPGRKGRSRFALVSRITPWLPGGAYTLTLLVCLVFLLLVNLFVAQPFQIPSGSMEQGLRVGDRVVVNKLAYRFGAEPERGDVVVFDGTGYFGGADYVKRVVGVGGDRVVCCDKEGRIEVNGRPVDESTFLYPGDSPSSVPFEAVVPDGRLFLLGDHRSASSDSRDRLGSPGGGMVPVGAVIGRAEAVVWPLGHAALLHRPEAYAGVPAGDRGDAGGVAAAAGSGSGTGTGVGPAGSVAVGGPAASVAATGSAGSRDADGPAGSGGPGRGAGGGRG